MAVRTSNLRSLPHKTIKTLTYGLVFSLVILDLSIIVTLAMEPKNWAIFNTCLGNPGFKANNLNIGLSFGFFLIIFFGIGLIHDYAMIKFIKKRKSLVKPEVQLVAWGEVPQPPFVSGLDYTRSTVPIKATCLGIVNIIIILAFNLLSTLAFERRSFAYLYGHIVRLHLFVQLPPTLMLTVKSNKKANPDNHGLKITPPRGLQFYE